MEIICFIKIDRNKFLTSFYTIKFCFLLISDNNSTNLEIYR